MGAVDLQGPQDAGGGQQAGCENVGGGFFFRRIRAFCAMTQEDMAQIMGDGEAAALGSILLIIDNGPALSVVYTSSRFVRSQLQHFAVFHQPDPGQADNTSDLHRQSINVIVDKALPGGVSALLIQSIDIIQIYHPGSILCFRGSFYLLKIQHLIQAR